MSSKVNFPTAANAVDNIWVVIPAYNEAPVIQGVLDGLLKLYPRVVVVDDCSTDTTGVEVAKTGAQRLRHPINLGQGAALQTGITYALQQGAEVIVTFDADGQHDANSIATLIAPILAGEVDIVLGSRFLGVGQAVNIPTRRRLLLKAATCFTRFTSGLRITDTHNGFRAFSRNAAQRINLTLNRMAHASQILSQIAEMRLPYSEIPVTIVYTEYSLSKGQKISNFFNIVWESLLGVLRR